MQVKPQFVNSKTEVGRGLANSMQQALFNQRRRSMIIQRLCKRVRGLLPGQTGRLSLQTANKRWMRPIFLFSILM